MDGNAHLSIGELARRTGVGVKTIRYYSDRGIVAPAGRTAAGYRFYGADAVARLGLVRTLRELGLGLDTIRQVADREVPLPEVAAAHVEALEVQIRVLRLRQALLAAVAERRLTPEETDLMHQLARLTDDERRRLVDDFLHAVFDGLALDGVARTLTPDLPDHPDAEQTRAWAELAALAQDPGFRADLRRTAREIAAEQPRGAPPRRGFAAAVRDLVAPALAAGLDPASRDADPVVEAVAAEHSGAEGLLPRLRRLNDPRRERYVQLLAVINGWPAPESPAPALDWAAEAVRVRMA
ncbi:MULTISPECIES: MerR family transcriptional regulator [unclassified Streptomyces]|uniref:MerR family transcriptional regulator n=1 Tax=unclassified Streptomyces TaxID=2593676 RepID=UPI002ED05280|nr:MerR family transcriptional regulator [Streptomyces sp. NBC_00891]WSY05933.1 MerR family transcriptional regulator [Streptomyces sp. NBC_00890]WSZ07557.1 MerR family transcriptional regulator [Streptomyces sp. NBC_00869]WSZ24944.1 MerR family transcriptional regulator [Streptomyces sp. NBC_00870]